MDHQLFRDVLPTVIFLDLFGYACRQKDSKPVDVSFDIDVSLNKLNNLLRLWFRIKTMKFCNLHIQGLFEFSFFLFLRVMIFRIIRESL